jgi:hypothetical protein
MTHEEQLAKLVDRGHIADVLHHLCHLIDTFQLHRFDEVYAADASDDHGGGPVVGLEAIKDWYADSTANIAAVTHNLSNLVIDVFGDSATARSNVVAYAWTMSNEHLGPMRPVDYALVLGYHDRLQRLPEGWRVTERVLVPGVAKSGEPHLIAAGELATSQTGIQSLSRRSAPRPSD